MKKLGLLLLFTILTFMGCNSTKKLDDNPMISVSSNNGTAQLSTVLTIPGLKFGIFPISGDALNITKYAPNASTGGFRSVILYSKYPAEFTSARANGYYPILGALNRSQIKRGLWKSQVDSLFTICNADWAYIDDGYSDYNSTDPAGPYIDYETITELCEYVHTNYPGKLVATSEYYLIRCKTNPAWFSKIDVVMPYWYIHWASDDPYYRGVVWDYELYSFLQEFKNFLPNKIIVPFLGFQADCALPSPDNPKYYWTWHIDQLGQKESTQLYKSYIEVAAQFSTMNLIYYYWDYKTGYTTSLDRLVSYLQRNSYMIPNDRE